MEGIIGVLVIVALVLFLWMIGWGVFWFLVQAGIIMRKAVEPPADSTSFTLEQSREVKSEEQ
ncbi:MAG TPA: hypothetical protein PKD53_01220 [Chloroflexaceae bacterium]|nr:hypothetical protein [Chloroflexaceae bacterium]